MRVMLVGQSWLGAEVLASLLGRGHDVAAVAAPAGDRLYVAAVDAGVPVSNHGGALPAARVPPGTELIVCAHAHLFVSQGARERARHGAIGYHPSLLPRHRGRDAVRWTIHMGDPIAGGTVYWMIDKADAGPIAAQDWCWVRRDDTPLSLWKRELGPLGVRLLTQVVDLAATGHFPKADQDESHATWEPAFARPRLAER